MMELIFHIDYYSLVAKSQSFVTFLQVIHNSSLLGRLLKTGLSLLTNVLKPLAKSILIPLRLITTASATDTTIEKKIHNSRTTLIISTKEI